MKAKQAISAIVEDDAQDALRTLAELNGSNYVVDTSIPEDETADVLSKDGTCRFPYAPHSSMNVAWIRGRKVKVPANVAVVLYQAAFGDVEASMLIDDWVDSLTPRGIREDKAEDALDFLGRFEIGDGVRILCKQKHNLRWFTSPPWSLENPRTGTIVDIFAGYYTVETGGEYHEFEFDDDRLERAVEEDAAQDALDAYDDGKEFKIGDRVKVASGWVTGVGVIVGMDKLRRARLKTGRYCVRLDSRSDRWYWLLPYDLELETSSLAEGRDDINTLPIPASAKQYARMSGLKWTGPAKRKLYMKVAADLANPTRKPDRWRNFDCAGKVQHSIKI